MSKIEALKLDEEDDDDDFSFGDTDDDFGKFNVKLCCMNNKKIPFSISGEEEDDCEEEEDALDDKEGEK